MGLYAYSNPNTPDFEQPEAAITRNVMDDAASECYFCMRPTTEGAFLHMATTQMCVQTLLLPDGTMWVVYIGAGPFAAMYSCAGCEPFVTGKQAQGLIRRVMELGHPSGEAWAEHTESLLWQLMPHLISHLDSGIKVK